MPDFAQNKPLWEAVLAAIVLGAAILFALFVHPVLTRVAHTLTRKTTTTLDDVLVLAVARPLVLFILVQGVFLALTITSYLDPWQAYIQKAWLAAVLGVVFYGLQRLTSAFIQWYGQEVAVKPRGRMDEKLLPLLRRFVTAVIYGLGALLILDNLGIKVSPLLAGLGLGGIAVALSVQPTLSNFIAGVFVVADGSIGVGDFIEIQSGPSGDVVDIGWRSTKIQTPQGNLVIIPNGKLGDSIVTNYQSPTPEVNVFVNCGVAYESDLERVEVVCVEVAREVMRELPDAVAAKEFEPVVRFREFGESNINFFVLLRGESRLDAMRVQHEFMKRLQTRFAREGIEISYPVRKLVYPIQDGQRTPRP